MSATINPQKFLNYFNDSSVCSDGLKRPDQACWIEIPEQKKFNITTYYIEDAYKQLIEAVKAGKYVCKLWISVLILSFLCPKYLRQEWKFLLDNNIILVRNNR